MSVDFMQQSALVIVILQTIMTRHWSVSQEEHLVQVDAAYLPALHR